jgi:hypothetical protein
LLHHHRQNNIDQHDLNVKEYKLVHVGQDVVMHGQVEVKHDQDVVLLVQQGLHYNRQLDRNYRLVDVQLIVQHQLLWN